MVCADIAVLGATELEVHALRAALKGQQQVSIGGRPVTLGNRGGGRVAVLAGGIGKVNAALAAQSILQSSGAGLLLAIGVGGAFPAAGLGIGDLAVASEEVYGDEGVESDEGWQGLEAIGIPLWQAQGRDFFNRVPADLRCSELLLGAAQQEGNAARGPFVTVSTVTGTANRAAALQARFFPLCESMEGAAAAHAALAAGARFAEVRGISNLVGPRDRSSWQLEQAAAAAQRAALGFFDCWAELDQPALAPSPPPPGG